MDAHGGSDRGKEEKSDKITDGHSKRRQLAVPSRQDGV